MQLLQIKDEAKRLQKKENISYNQALTSLAKKKGYKSYQALKHSIETSYLKESNQVVRLIKENIVKNLKHIQSDFTKYQNIHSSDFNMDQDGELYYEQLEDITNKIDALLLSGFYGTRALVLDNCDERSFGIALYDTSDVSVMMNDYDSKNCDHFLDILIDRKEIEYTEFVKEDINDDGYIDLVDEKYFTIKFP